MKNDQQHGTTRRRTGTVTTVPTSWVFQGRCWKFGNNIPTDAMTPTHVMFKSPKEMAAFVLETLNPEFPKRVQPGDILVAGRNFGCSSGRALAAKALQATGIGAVVAERFARTFYRNGHEIGLPLLEASGIHALVSDGDLVRVDIKAATVDNVTTGKRLQGNPPSQFLLGMLEAGGLIPLLKSGFLPGTTTR
jgi:3-isopropylmalate/(R)-2-methylmalate dehydratase small subunit